LLIPKLTSEKPAPLTYKQQVQNSITGVKQISATFLSAEKKCTDPSCSTNAATDAVNSIGTIASKFNYVDYPSRAQLAAGNFAHEMTALQRVFLSIGFLN